MANYTDKPKKHASRDIAVDKLDFYTEPHKSPKKQDKIKGRPKSGFSAPLNCPGTTVGLPQ